MFLKEDESKDFPLISAMTLFLFVVDFFADIRATVRPRAGRLRFLTCTVVLFV